MNSGNLYRHICATLATTYDPREAQALSRIIIEDILHLSFTKALAGILPHLDEHDASILNDTLRRLCDHVPIQHIIGHTLFCSLKISVNRSVLIPRPETEQIVSLATSLLSTNPTSKVIDVCTGSGCIAIALKKQNPQATITATDISEAALQTARNNAKENNADITFIKSDIIAESLPSDNLDLIVSNPPYVRDIEKKSMKPNVLNHEPHLALFVSDNRPLVFYEALARQGQDHLKTGGHLLVEINQYLATETCRLFADHGYKEVTLFTDCFGNNRFIQCQK